MRLFKFLVLRGIVDMELSPEGMVCAAHPLAVEAGWEILRAGGSAFDTAVAVAAVLNVVETDDVWDWRVWHHFDL